MSPRDERVSDVPHIMSDEEIDLMLDGDRRQVDKIMLKSINRLTAVIVPHAQREDERDRQFDSVMDQIGGSQAIIDRAKVVDALIRDAEIDATRKAFIDAVIDKQTKRNAMMEKVSTSNVIWASIAFLGYLAYILREAIVAYAKTRLGS